MDSCNVTAKPGTDIWRKPPNVNRFNAPYQSLARKPLNSFISAQLTLSLTPTTQYDQAGLLLILHPPPTYATPESLSQDPSPSEKYWLKTGVELYDSQPRVSTVACEKWADWSIAPLQSDKDIEVTVAVQRVTGHHGSTLWVYKIGKDGERVPLRELFWVFALDGDGAGGWEVEVAAYAARPNKDADEELRAAFKDIKLEWV